MNAPFYKFGAFGDEVSLIIAFVIGIGFGFALERAGFGSARKLAAQFYLRDLAVLKVMFTAIITAMVGLFLLSVVGIVDLSMIYLVPTYVVPQVVGGVLLGIGFVIGGYCPGTSVVSAGTGRIDGMTYLVGVGIGIFVYGEVYPAIAGWTQSTAMGQVTLPGWLNVSYGLVVFAVVLMAVVAFVFAEIAEKHIGGVQHGPASLTNLAKKLNFSRGLMGVLLVLGFLAIFMGNPYRGEKTTIDAKALAMIAGGNMDQMEVETVAEQLVSGTVNFTLVDLRDEAEYQQYHIPSAVNMELAALNYDAFPRNESIVLYANDGVTSAQAWFLFKAKGYPSVYLLSDGLDAWKNEILYPSKPVDESVESLADFAKKAEMATFFGGKARDSGPVGAKDMGIPDLPDMPAAAEQTLPMVEKKKRREGC